MVETLPPPAVAVLDVDSVAAGIVAVDAMVKRAPIAVVKAGTVHPGRYLILIAGSVAAVEEAHREGLARTSKHLVDEVLLCDIATPLARAVLGDTLPLAAETLGIVESRSVPALLRGVDAAVKATEVSIAAVRLADGLGGNAFALIDGPLPDVEAALEIAAERISVEYRRETAIIPRLDPAVRALLDHGTHFAPCPHIRPEGAETGAAR